MNESFEKPKCTDDVDLTLHHDERDSNVAQSAIPEKEPFSLDIAEAEALIAQSQMADQNETRIKELIRTGEDVEEVVAHDVDSEGTLVPPYVAARLRDQTKGTSDQDSQEAA
ncbi:MAG: hypothetical protein ACI9VM_000138 [Candidatus Azotimanducaceae bacterium]|jgi:hypothetical protein